MGMTRRLVGVNLADLIENTKGKKEKNKKTCLIS